MAVKLLLIKCENASSMPHLRTAREERKLLMPSILTWPLLSCFVCGFPRKPNRLFPQAMCCLQSWYVDVGECPDNQQDVPVARVDGSELCFYKILGRKLIYCSYKFTNIIYCCT